MRKSKHNDIVNDTLNSSDCPGSYRKTFVMRSRATHSDWPEVCCAELDTINNLGKQLLILCYFKDDAAVWAAHEDACGDSS